MHQIPMFAITGGDNGGKSTGIPRAREYLMKLGYTVFVCPEAATGLIQKGYIPGGTVSNEVFQEMVFKKILANEAKYLKAAKRLDKHAKVVILCDRGLIDGFAYCDRAFFLELCRKFGGNVTTFRDKRYAAAIHLRTAAFGAEQSYNYDNPARIRRTLNEARELDERTLRAWIGHPHLRVIPNKPGATFDAKMDHMIAEIAHVLGEPMSLEVERKFLVEIPDWNLLPYFECVPITQHYLVRDKDGVRRRVRARGPEDAPLYVETAKQKFSDISWIEKERHISKTEYTRLCRTLRDETRIPIRKDRHCFVSLDQYFELDVFAQPLLPYAALEIELLHEKQEVILPPFLKIIREVSGDPYWTNSAIAKRAAT